MRFLLFSLLLTAMLPVQAQRIAQERVYTDLRGPLTVFQLNDAVLTPQGQFFASGPGLSTTAQTRDNYFLLLNPVTLDTLWTRKGGLMLVGSQRVHALANGNLMFCGNVQPSFAVSTQEWAIQWLTSSGRIRRTTQLINPFGNDHEFGASLPAADRGVFVVGNTSAISRWRNQVIRTDSVGQVQWVRNYGWSPSDYIWDMCYTQWGTLLLAGMTDRPFQIGQPIRLKLLEVNQQGDSLRGRSFLPLGLSRDVQMRGVLNRLRPLRDGGVLLTADADSIPNVARLALVSKLDSALQPVWTYVHRPQPLRDMAYTGSVELTDGSLLVLAYDSRRLAATYYLHRLSASGQLLAQYPLTSQLGTQLKPVALVPGPGNALFVVGTAYPRHAYVARIDLQTLPGAVVLSAPAAPFRQLPAATFTLFPNPAASAVTVQYELPRPSTTLVLMVTNLKGQRVLSRSLPTTTRRASLDISPLPVGLYAVTLLLDGTPLATHKLVVAY